MIASFLMTYSAAGNLCGMFQTKDYYLIVFLLQITKKTQTVMSEVIRKCQLWTNAVYLQYTLWEVPPHSKQIKREFKTQFLLP